MTQSAAPCIGAASSASLGYLAVTMVEQSVWAQNAHFGAGRVYPAILVQNAQDDAVGASFLEGPDVLSHDAELRIGV